jgi:hypothetical protein
MAMQRALWCVLFLFLPAFANAQSGAAAIQTFGLMGTWAGECKENPSPANNHATYSLTASGAVQLKNSFGEGYDESIYNIVDARRVGSDKISLRQVLASDNEVVLDIVLLKENGKIRMWSSLTVEGQTLVKDGMVAAPVSRETRWSTHC